MAHTSAFILSLSLSLLKANMTFEKRHHLVNLDFFFSEEPRFNKASCSANQFFFYVTVFTLTDKWHKCGRLRGRYGCHSVPTNTHTHTHQHSTLEVLTHHTDRNTVGCFGSCSATAQIYLHPTNIASMNLVMGCSKGFFFPLF